MYNSMKWTECCFTLGHDWEVLPFAFERRRKLTYLKTNTGFSPSICSHLMKTMSFDLCNTNNPRKNILLLPDPSPSKPAHSSGWGWPFVPRLPPFVVHSKYKRAHILHNPAEFSKKEASKKQPRVIYGYWKHPPTLQTLEDRFQGKKQQVVKF